MKRVVGLIAALLFIFGSASAFACDDGDGGGGDSDYQAPQMSTELAPQGTTVACDGDKGGDDDKS